MKSIVVYESRYGNTAHIARAIATGLEAAGPVQVVEVGDMTAFDITGVDLLVIGGPTEGHGVSLTLREWLTHVPPEVLRDVNVAAFDTRLNWPAFLAGSAAHGIAQVLQRKGAKLLIPPESFLVSGMKDVHLVDGEIERAGVWAERIRADCVVSQQPYG
jgi:flavodoxin